MNGLASVVAAAALLSPSGALAFDGAYFNVTSPCAETVVLPEPTGPHQIGTSTFFFTDPDRPETLTGDPHDLRQVIFQLWYPALRDRDTDPEAYVPELDLMRAGFSADNREMPQKIAAGLAHYGCVVTHAFPDIAASDLQAKFPVIVFSPGGNMSRHWHTAQAQEFASHGYVVLVLSHAHSGMDVFPSGGLLMSSQSWRTPEGASEEAERQTDDALSDTLAGDARFALTKLLEVDAGSLDHPLNGRIDEDRIAIVGHSRGGKTVARSCANDPRFKACVTYDNLAPAREQESGLQRPQLTIRAEWQPQRIAALHDYMARNPSAAFDVALKDASHFTFSDLQIVDPENYDHELDPVTGLSRSNRITLSFLDAVLNGREVDVSSLAGDGTTVWTNLGD